VGGIGEPAERVLVLEFWATWCPPCRDSIPHLTQVQAQYQRQKKNVVIVGITNEAESTVRPFVTKMDKKMEYVVALDQTSETNALKNGLQVRGIPHAVIVDKTNTIVFSGHPMDQEFERELEKAAGNLAQAKPAKITLSREELQALSIGALKSTLRKKNFFFSGRVFNLVPM